jgi:phage gp29-like protein
MTSKGTRPEIREIAAPALRDRWSTYPSAGLTPRRLTAVLREADGGDLSRQMALFTEMEEKDAHLFSCLQTRKLAVAGSPWEVMPSGATGADSKAAAFVGEALRGVDNFEEALMDLLDGVGKGFSVSEIMWEAGHAGVVPVSLRKRSSGRFTFVGPEGVSERPRLLTEAEPVYGVGLAPDKFAVHIYRAGADQPERGGLLRVLSWIYLFKNYALKDWVGFCEVFGMPLRLGVYSPSAGKEDRQALVEAVTRLGSDAAGVISESTRIEFVESARRGEGPYSGLIELLNREMSKAVLGQTLTTDVGSSGSYAAGMVHQGVRSDIARADARALERTINRDVVRPIVRFNFGPGTRPPVFRFQMDEPEDLMALATRDKLLHDMGLSIPEGYLRDRYDIPGAGDGPAAA